MDPAPSKLLQALLVALRAALQSDGSLTLNSTTLGGTCPGLVSLLKQARKDSFVLTANVKLPSSVAGVGLELSGEGEGLLLTLSCQDVGGELRVEVLFTGSTLDGLCAAFPLLGRPFFADIEPQSGTLNIDVAGLSPLLLRPTSFGLVGRFVPQSGFASHALAPCVSATWAGDAQSRSLSVEIGTPASPYRIIAVDEASWAIDDVEAILGFKMQGALPGLFEGAQWKLAGFLLNLFPAAASTSALVLHIVGDAGKPLWTAASGKVQLSDALVRFDLESSPTNAFQLASRGSVRGDFRLGTLALSAEIPFPFTSGVWWIASQPNLPLGDLKGLASLLEEPSQMNGMLPASLGNHLEAGGFQLSQLRVAIDPKSFSLVEFSFGVSCERHWPLIDGVLELAGLQLLVTIYGGASPGIVGFIDGHFGLGSAGDVHIRLGRVDPKAPWRLSIFSPWIALPSLKDIAKVVHGVDLAEHLQIGKLGEQRFVITDLLLGLDFAASGPQLGDIGLTLKLAGPDAKPSPYGVPSLKADWEVVPGALTLMDFEAGFRVSAGGQSVEAFGAFVVNGLGFELRFGHFTDQGVTTNAFVAAYSAPGVAAAGQLAPLSIGLHALVYSLSPTLAEFVPESLDLELKDALVLYLERADVQKYAFVIDIHAGFSLSNLPLIGHALASHAEASLANLKLVIASEALTVSDVTVLNDLLSQLPEPVAPFAARPAPQGPAVPPGSAVPPTTPSDVAIAAGFSLIAELKLGPSSVLITSPSPPAAPPKRALTVSGLAGERATTAPMSGGQDTTWFSIEQSFGPLSLQRVGVKYRAQDQSLWFELDASLGFGPLTLSLFGLGIGSPLHRFAPEFALAGLGVAYSNPPLSITGSLINVATQPEELAFEGELGIATGELNVNAFGYYGNTTGFASMFAFADIASEFGGPPAFFITGVALGFGYNSSLRLPSIEQVATFPFLQALATSTPPQQDPFGPNAAPAQVLEILRSSAPPWISPALGELWFAAGITFTSFGIVNSQALAVVQAGKELVLSLLGTSRAAFPQPAENLPPYAQIEMDLELCFAPNRGEFSLQAVLARSSFVFSPACVLSGGFAFYVWFGKNAHAGDFVVTVGGYHRAFTPAPWYPMVPTVGFDWPLSPELSLRGSAYFALTPSALMFGGRLDATYQSSNLRVWFAATADAMIQWKPFWFDLNVGITVGASYTFHLGSISATLSLELGCVLELWGPPTSGVVTVDLYVFEVKVPFGPQGKAERPTLADFSQMQSMLPDNGNLTLAASRGLIPDGTRPTPQSAQRVSATEPEPWIVRGGHFGFSLQSPIPATSLKVGAQSFSGSLDVAPLGWSAASSEVVLGIVDSAQRPSEGAFDLQQQIKDVPVALWGTPASDPKKLPVPNGAQQLVKDKLIGITLEAKAPTLGKTSGAVDVGQDLVLFPLNLPGAVLPLSATPPNAAPLGDHCLARLVDPKRGIASSQVSGVRDSIFHALVTAGIAPSSRNDAMTKFAESASCSFVADPLLLSRGTL